jgi:hypothetical protein
VLPTAHNTLRAEGTEPVTTPVVKQLECVVSATLTKRRPAGPALVVGRVDGKGLSMVMNDGSSEPKTFYTENRTGSDAQPLLVPRANLMQTTERGLTRALTGLVAPVDRELAMRSKPATTAAGTPATPQ